MRIHKPRNPARTLSDLAGSPPSRRPVGGVVRPAGRGRAEPVGAVPPARPIRPMPKPTKPRRPEATPMPKPTPRRRVPPKG